MKHLTQEKRDMLAVWRRQGRSQKECALLLGYSPSAISRELSKNSDNRNGKYNSVVAGNKAMKRQKDKRTRVDFTDEMKAIVIQNLKENYSPEEIVGRCREEGIPMVSYQTIYLYIWEDRKRKGSLYTHLRRNGRHYTKRGSKKTGKGIIPGRRGIEERPKIVEERSRIGDLELDLIVGSGYKRAILTIVDRCSGKLWMGWVADKEATTTSTAILRLLKPEMSYIQTITTDNGKEFSSHQFLSEELGADWYFARPYHSWERGTNENTNGLIRQYFPKGSDFNLITSEMIQFAQEQLNNRPRKRHGFYTPNEVHRAHFTPCA
jgi:IS30 family transposase